MSHGKTRRCPDPIGLVAVTFPITVEPAGAPVGMRVTEPAPGLTTSLASAGGLAMRFALPSAVNTARTTKPFFVVFPAPSKPLRSWLMLSN